MLSMSADRFMGKRAGTCRRRSGRLLAVADFLLDLRLGFSRNHNETNFQSPRFSAKLRARRHQRARGVALNNDKAQTVPCGDKDMGTTAPAPEGIGIGLPPGTNIDLVKDQVTHLVRRLGSPAWCKTDLVDTPSGRVFRIRLRTALFAKLADGFDTLALRRRLAGSSSLQDAELLMREVWVAMLSAPVRIDFDHVQELQAHLRIRCNIARAAEKTALAFKTTAAERPADFWHDEPEVGFLLKPDVGLIDALIAATQPERTGRLYDFSCYRATEYVILLGIAQEAQRSAPTLYASLEEKARRQCIKSGLFHEVFLTEYGTVQAPIPHHYYVPGDRVWFKNPDPVSSNAPGYEGSWVIYLGGGRFSNFWKRDAPYSLHGKALEVYHWRHGAYLDDAADMHMDEVVVEAKVALTRADAVKRQRVLKRMSRYRDPMGVYADGGCIDASREFPRPLQAIVLP
jgi:hypothetical protein